VHRVACVATGDACVVGVAIADVVDDDVLASAAVADADVADTDDDDDDVRDMVLDIVSVGVAASVSVIDGVVDVRGVVVDVALGVRCDVDAPTAAAAGGVFVTEPLLPDDRDAAVLTPGDADCCGTVGCTGTTCRIIHVTCVRTRAIIPVGPTPEAEV
jgi:hypothetical protein